MLLIQRSPTADSRTCDVTQVSKQQLLESSRQHIQDVASGLGFFINKLLMEAATHDYDKLTEIDQFYEDFRLKFSQTIWWDNHRKLQRHHLEQADGVPADVNLLDVLAYITDCVMAGKARTGAVRPLVISDELLRTAFNNTVTLLDKNVSVID
jgi:hypothetical protein